MHLKRLFVFLLFVAPIMSFAAPSWSCAESTAERTRWAKQYQTRIDQAWRALEAEDIGNAATLIFSAGDAANRACMSDASTARLKVAWRVLRERQLDRLMFETAVLITKSEYDEAQRMLSKADRWSQNWAVELPEGYTLLLQTANKGLVTDFFTILDKQKLSPEDFATLERSGCKDASELGIVLPERCNKYK